MQIPLISSLYSQPNCAMPNVALSLSLSTNVNSEPNTLPWTFKDFSPMVFRKIREYFCCDARVYMVLFIVSEWRNYKHIGRRSILITVWKIQFCLGPEKILGNALFLGNLCALCEANIPFKRGCEQKIVLIIFVLLGGVYSTEWLFFLQVKRWSLSHKDSASRWVFFPKENPSQLFSVHSGQPQYVADKILWNAFYATGRPRFLFKLLIMIIIMITVEYIK